MKLKKTKMSIKTKKIKKKVTINIEELLKNDAPYLLEDGKINLGKLKNLLRGEMTENEDDRFYFNWAGKNKVFQAIQAPTYSTLVPQKNKSINWDKTENLMIVGENLETLKLLLKPYFGQVKVIYIDPPYNTGKDFIYKDDFTSPLKEYLEKTRQKDSNGNKLTTLSETSGRYHSDWLNFMYPRLFLARNLLKDDGVIFISIDDHEVHHLRVIMDEIFGEDNFVAEFPRITKKAGKTTDLVAKNTDYILCYGRSDKVFLNRSNFSDDEYKYSDEYENKRGKYKLSQTLDYSSIQYSPSLDYEIELDNFVFRPGGVSKQKMIERQKRNPSSDFCWRWSKELFDFGLKNGFIVVKESKNGKRIYTKTYKNAVISKKGKSYFVELKKRTKAVSTLEFVENKYSNDNSRKEIARLFETKVFEYSKPVSLLKKLVKIGTENNDLVLDFFAGSGTTGDAVIQLNAEDGGNRKYILVQLQEKTDKKSEAYRAGYKNISDICIERLRRVSEKIKNKDKNKLIKENGKLDLGFKVFKLSPSNFNLKEEFELNENKDLRELKENYLKQLGLYVSQPIVPTAKAIDIVYEIIIKNGFSLNSEIKTIKIGNNKFYFIRDEANDLEVYICLDSKINNSSVEKIRTNEYKGKIFAFYDNALTDSQKINLNTFVKLQVI